MKRKNNLYKNIYMYDNLHIAFYKAAKGKGDKNNVKIFVSDLDKNLKDLQKQFMEKNLNIGNYHFFHIKDPKPRYICAAQFHERVIHHAIMNIIEPVLDKYSIDDSYACRKNKGTLKAINRCQFFCRRNDWYLKMDIKKYFDSIDHTILIKLLERKIKDKSILLIFKKIFDTYHVLPCKGLPIGNLISQHTANFYLGIFDHWIKEKLQIKAYLRYMDDFAVFGKTKSELKSIHSQIQTYLWDKLKIELKHTTQLNRSTIGIPFLGFRIYPGKILLTPNSKRRFIRKFIRYEHKLVTGEWDEEKYIEHVRPLFDFAQIGDTLEFRRHVLNRFGVLS